MPTTESSRKTLYLIDGSAYIYRAFFALPALNNSQGLQTNAILGFTTTLLKILRERKPDGLVVAFDEKGPTLRHAEFKAYKAQRPPMPEGMSAQIPYIHRVVDALNIPAVRQAGYEADDLIGTLAHQAEQAGFDVVIVTGDKDMFQLLTPHVRIYDPVKDKWLGEAECRERFGVEPARVVEIMGLMGDATDNIPGVKGIGEKTAMKLIAQFGTIEELLRRVEEVTPPRIKALLIEQAENARLSRRLATIQLDSPVAFDACDLSHEASPSGPAHRFVARAGVHHTPQILSADRSHKLRRMQLRRSSFRMNRPRSDLWRDCRRAASSACNVCSPLGQVCRRNCAGDGAVYGRQDRVHSARRPNLHAAHHIVAARPHENQGCP